MDYHVFKSMLNRYYSRYIGGESRPVFLDVSTDFPALSAVTENFADIRREFDQLMQCQTELPQYHVIDPGEREISADEAGRNWNVFMLEILGHKPSSNRARCPQTCRALSRVPNLLQAFFSILEPGKSIPEHEGPYLGYLRYHLALRVPAADPPHLVIRGEEYQWNEGEAVLFDDTWPHSVKNNSKSVRAVLVVDVMRPMPMMPALLNRFTSNVVARHTYGRSVARKVEQFGNAA